MRHFKNHLHGRVSANTERLIRSGLHAGPDILRLMHVLNLCSEGWQPMCMQIVNGCSSVSVVNMQCKCK